MNHDMDINKMKKLEETLRGVLENLDKEIIQTDVEWLHLKHISETLNGPSSSTPLGLQEKCNDEKAQPISLKDGLQKISFRTDVKADNVVMNNAPLYLEVSNEVHQFRLGSDEEFDSD